ncbi:prenyltransferase/squalene oxidase repeat-containing protein [Streptomyces sp. DSM 44915]|uniref:Prenyltransferase/squalene oxidase repeat-containing protein n=1 Tax=Streptomyces chisholmiae TaxID=3075540 RepID=A0ABU2JVF1_9ACTN|nr:prenyltransferase/squalene oxidase repeat-containing protein [Streptomyces sp. DSM 44915]MDT0268738.1 prenyltransferase/squalene oxidase repeat-containing protein [Streptomyces sp. DSM 44915]
MNFAAKARSASDATAVGRAALCDRQGREGNWAGDLAVGGTMWDAADILMHHFLDTADPARIAEQRAWIVSQQNADGGFPVYTGGPSDLSCSVVTHLALQLAGHPEDREALERAAGFVRAHGGIESIEMIPARFWLAFVGVVSWDDIAPLPPELILLPRWFPGSVYDFEPLAREVVVAVGILGVVRPVRRLPLETAPLRAGPARRGSPRPAFRAEPARAAGTAVLRLAHGLNRVSPTPLRRRALHRAERWLLGRQEPDGTWGGSWAETMVCALALHSLGFGKGHPAIARGLAACDAYHIRRDGTLRVRTFHSTVMDTAITLRALAAAGSRAGADPAADRAVAWLLAHRSDATHNAPHPPARVWDFHGIPSINPDVDDTAMVIGALSALRATRTPETAAAVAEGIRWVMEWQTRSGGWSGYGMSDWALVGGRALAGISFVEPPSPCVTAHVVEMLCLEGFGWHPRVRRALRWLFDQQAVDGSWATRWGGRLYGTTQVLIALRAAGFAPDHPAMAAAMEFLFLHQNDDGGWGEDIASAFDPTRPAAGTSSVTQTAWCLSALHLAGLADADPKRVSAAADYLMARQEADGTWADEREWLIIIPNNVYASDDALTNAFALWALALHAAHTEPAEEESR